jgi:hypothetical protein
MCAQVGVRPGIVVKEKDVFHISVRTNFMDALPLVMCSEVEARNLTTLVCIASYSTLAKMC